jgi:uncharacterized OB-fold protein
MAPATKKASSKSASARQAPARTAASKGAAAPAAQVPIVSYLKLGARPALQAAECTTCGARYFDRRERCSKCRGTTFRKVRVANTGVLRAFTIVYRAAPGVPTPFVSGIIETTDGTQVNANVVGVDPDPEHVTLGMRLKLTTYVVGTDDNGTEAVAFGYQP